MPRRRDARFGLPPHVHVVRSGVREYYYYQENRGRAYANARFRLPGDPYTREGLPDEEWWNAYRLVSGSTEGLPKPGTFEALISEYQQSPEWLQLSDRTRTAWRYLLPKIKEPWGDLPVNAIEAHHILKLRDAYAQTPATANNILRLLSTLLSWGVRHAYLPGNPCLLMRKVKLKAGDPYQPWSWDAVSLFKRVAHPMLWNAAALALFTGQRQADVLKMRWSDIEGQLVAVEQSKTKKKLWIPIHQGLQEVLNTLDRDNGTILKGRRGQTLTSGGFQCIWRKQMEDERLASLRQQRLVYHGLRKSAVVMLLEAGCTDAEVASITGQTRDMVEHYAREVNQKRLAAVAMRKWESAASE